MVASPKAAYKGSPVSDTHKPRPNDIIALWNFVLTSAAAGGRAVNSLPALEALSPTQDGAGGLIWASGDPAVDGIYSWDLGTTTWTRLGALPIAFSALENIGGTANAITADVAAYVSPGELKWAVFTPLYTNTLGGGEVIDLGNGNEPLANGSGGDLAPGDLVGGVTTQIFKDDSGAWRQMVSSRPGATMDFQGTWNSGTAYTQAQFVTKSNVLYYLDAASSTNEDPASGSPWLSVVDFSTILSAGSVTPDKMSDDDFGADIKMTVWTSGQLRTLKQRATDTYCILDAPGSPDPTGTNDSATALKAMIAEGIQCELTKGDFVTTEPLLLKNTSQRIVGQGMGYGYGRPDYFARHFEPVSRIIGAGTFAKRVLTRRKYRASGSDPTDDAMSAIIEVHADGVSLEDFCVWLNCDYTDLSHTNLGDDIDIGVFRAGRPGFKTRNLAIIGHFRKTKLLHDYTRALNLPELLDPDGAALPAGVSGETFAGGDGWNHHNILMWGWGSGFTEYGPIHPGGSYYDEATGAVTDERGRLVTVMEGSPAGGNLRCAPKWQTVG